MCANGRDDCVHEIQELSKCAGFALVAEPDHKPPKHEIEMVDEQIVRLHR